MVEIEIFRMQASKIMCPSCIGISRPRYQDCVWRSGVAVAGLVDVGLWYGQQKRFGVEQERREAWHIFRREKKENWKHCRPFLQLYRFTVTGRLNWQAVHSTRISIYGILNFFGLMYRRSLLATMNAIKSVIFYGLYVSIAQAVTVGLRRTK